MSVQFSGWQMVNVKSTHCQIGLEIILEKITEILKRIQWDLNKDWREIDCFISFTFQTSE